jgi:hypothetical protein
MKKTFVNKIFCVDGLWEACSKDRSKSGFGLFIGILIGIPRPHRIRPHHASCFQDRTRESLVPTLNNLQISENAVAVINY